MRLNWTIKLHVHNHYCGNSCGKIGKLSLGITCQPLGMFEVTIFLLQLHFNAHLLWNPQCGYMHIHDDQLLMIAMYGSIDEGVLVSFQRYLQFRAQLFGYIFIFLFVYLCIYCIHLYLHISLYEYVVCIALLPMTKRAIAKICL